MVLTVKGKGAKDVKNKNSEAFGDLKVKIMVETPVDMNEDQKKAMEEFLAATPEAVRPW